MARFLFVVPPLSGHINPTVSLGAELAARGHEVAWAGLPGLAQELLPSSATFLATNQPDEADAGNPVALVAERASGLRGAAALKFLWEDVLFPLARGMAPGVEAAIDQFDPDVVIADQQALAGAVAAKRRGLRWATSATTSAELVDPLAALPMVDGWVRDELVKLQLDAGMAPDSAASGDLRLSPDLVLAFTTEALVGRDEPFPHHYCFVGPSIGSRPAAASFPWEWLDPERPAVLVSLGTVSADAGARFFTVAAEAMADQPWQAIFVAPPELVPDPPANVLVQHRVPQLDLLPHLATVVTHAGHNTVCESLAWGLPLVLAPIRDDQPIVADQVVRAGAGIRVRFGRVRPAELRDAVARALADPSLRAAASVVRESFERAGGAPAAAAALVALAARS